MSLIFFDFETSAESNEHVVNFAVAQDFRGDTFVYEGCDALHEFCNFLFDDDHKDYTAIAHNAKSFDSIFILGWLLQNRPTADLSIIRNGQKIMQLLVRDYNIRIIDSINWFGMGLDKLAKTFGLDTSEFSKGTFPHLFNRTENWQYEGSIPDLKYCDEVPSGSLFLFWLHGYKSDGSTALTFIPFGMTDFKA